MKILYLHQYFKFPNESGGTRSYDLASSFERKGYNVEIITSTSDPAFKSSKKWQTIENSGLKVHYKYISYDNKFSYVKRIKGFLMFLWAATFKLFSIKSDIVIATSTPLTIGIPALIKKWIHKTPFIFEVRDVWPEAVIAIGAIKNKILQKILYHLEFIIYKNASAIVPLSIDMKESIVSRYPQLSNIPIITIENISEINRFQNPSLDQKSIIESRIGYKPRFIVLYAGTFGKVNGIRYVVKLAELLITIDTSIVFIMIGDGAEKNAIIKVAEEKELLNKNIFIFDAVSKQELPQLYYESSMGSSFVIDIRELWANSANKFFDTLAAGRPVLINHEGWQAKVINDENLGYVLPVKLTVEDVKTFVKYTQNVELHSIQCKNALEKAKESYSLEIASEKYLKILHSI